MSSVSSIQARSAPEMIAGAPPPPLHAAALEPPPSAASSGPARPYSAALSSGPLSPPVLARSISIGGASSLSSIASASLRASSMAANGSQAVGNIALGTNISRSRLSERYTFTDSWQKLSVGTGVVSVLFFAIGYFANSPTCYIIGTVGGVTTLATLCLRISYLRPLADIGRDDNILAARLREMVAVKQSIDAETARVGQTSDSIRLGLVQAEQACALVKAQTQSRLNQLTSLTQRIEASETRLRVLITLNQQVENSMKGRVEGLSSLKSSIDAEGKTLAPSVQLLGRVVDQLKTKRLPLDQRITGLREQNTAQQSILEQFQERIGELEGKIEQLREQRAALSALVQQEQNVGASTNQALQNARYSEGMATHLLRLTDEVDRKLERLAAFKARHPELCVVADEEEAKEAHVAVTIHSPTFLTEVTEDGAASAPPPPLLLSADQMLDLYASRRTPPPLPSPQAAVSAAATAVPSSPPPSRQLPARLLISPSPASSSFTAVPLRLPPIE